MISLLEHVCIFFYYSDDICILYIKALNYAHYHVIQLIFPGKYTVYHVPLCYMRGSYLNLLGGIILLLHAHLASICDETILHLVHCVLVLLCDIK